MIKRTAALLATTALLAVPATTLVAAPAHAVERGGVCGDGRFSLDVETDDGQYEIQGDLDNVKAGSRWKLVLKQDGKVIFKDTRRADNEGDIDVERTRPNTAGKDTFRFIATRVGGSPTCSTKVTL